MAATTCLPASLSVNSRRGEPAMTTRPLFGRRYDESSEKRPTLTVE